MTSGGNFIPRHYGYLAARGWGDFGDNIGSMAELSPASLVQRLNPSLALFDVTYN